VSFLETIRRAKSYLVEQGRVSLGALKLEFDLDDTRLESLIDELVDVQRVAVREGKTLAWIGSASVASASPETIAAPGHVSTLSGKNGDRLLIRDQLYLNSPKLRDVKRTEAGKSSLSPFDAPHPSATSDNSL